MKNYNLKKKQHNKKQIKNIGSGDTEIEKPKFHCHKSQILINDVDINKIIVSNRVSFHKKCFKHFTDYEDNNSSNNSNANNAYV